MSEPIEELAVVLNLVDVAAAPFGEETPRLIMAATAGTVVHVHREGQAVIAYEVEFPLGCGFAALATLLAHQVELAPAGYCRACPCCGCRTLTDLCPGSYEICPVCFWEDELIQQEDPHQRCGANRVNLVEARQNYRSFGACEKEALPYVRNPLPSEG